MKKVLLALAFVLGTASMSQASPIYTCPGSNSECSGQKFAVWLDAVGAGFFDFSFSINTTGYTGPAGSRAFGIEAKDLVNSNNQYTLVTLLAAPGNLASWSPSQSQLSQDCPPGASDFKNDQVCAVWNAGLGGYLFTVGDILTWKFRVFTAELPVLGAAQVHIKYEYKTDAGNGHVAGLLSDDVAFQDNRSCVEGCVPVPLTDAPEPASIVLLGTGLLAVAAGVRRFRA